MITVDQALQQITEAVKPANPEIIPLEQALGRILAEEVVADMDLPPFDRSRMDGYALRSEDVLSTPVTLRIVGEIAAGATSDISIGRGEAVKIFTGAPIPAGADAVQKVEVTEARGDRVLVQEPVKAGQFITSRASEVKAGEQVASRGRQIGAAEMAVLASFGYSKVRVGACPRVAVMSTGSELVKVTEKPLSSQIRNSNSYTIASYARHSGALVDLMDTVEDTVEATRRALLEAIKRADFVITSGGVSMGDYDLVKAALLEIGADIYFDKVSIRPGKPTVFARKGPTFFFGLPGNPVSTSVTFNVFVRPALRQWQGDGSPRLPTVRAELLESIRDASNRRSYLPALIEVEHGRAVVRLLKWVGSSDLVGFMNANSLIVVREDVHQLERGDVVDVFSLVSGINGS
jgi:molybdenum cofactor synthesis domain-containing protein